MGAVNLIKDWVSSLTATPTPTVVLLQLALQCLSSGDTAGSLARVVEVREAQWRVIHQPKWREVTDLDRAVYCAAAAIEAYIESISGEKSAALRTLDIAMLLAPRDQLDLLHILLDLLELTHGSGASCLDPAFVDAWVGTAGVASRKLAPLTLHRAPYAGCPGAFISRLRCPSVLEFYTAHFLTRSPVVLEHSLDAWPAHVLWADPHYLIRTAGYRTVPVELGSDYMSPGWTQSTMTMIDFLMAVQQRQLIGPSKPTPYLAQHALFDQIPALRRDVIVPDYCALQDPPQADASGSGIEPESLPVNLSAASTQPVSVPLSTAVTTAGTASGIQVDCHAVGRSTTATGSGRHTGMMSGAESARRRASATSAPTATGTPSQKCQCHASEAGASGGGARAGDSAGESADSDSESDSDSEPTSTKSRCSGGDSDSEFETRTSFVQATGSDGEVVVQAWIGPGGTVSCLHYDEPHNILAQVIGFKYIRLYSPEQTPRLYPREGAMKNTSAVDVAAPDGVAHPAFKEAPFLEYVLGPGDALYIPPHWWHYAAALSPSWSVSFWWGATY